MAVGLIMDLPRPIGMAPRVGFANIIMRYYAGDETVKGIIDENGNFSDGSRAASSDDREAKKRRLTETETARIKNMNDELDAVKSVMATMNSVDPDWKSNPKLRDKTMERLTKIMLGAESEL